MTKRVRRIIPEGLGYDLQQIIITIGEVFVLIWQILYLHQD